MMRPDSFLPDLAISAHDQAHDQAAEPAPAAGSHGNAPTEGDGLVAFRAALSADVRLLLRTKSAAPRA